MVYFLRACRVHFRAQFGQFGSQRLPLIKGLCAHLAGVIDAHERGSVVPLLRFQRRVRQILSRKPPRADGRRADMISCTIQGNASPGGVNPAPSIGSA